jgi:hypothetical protein
VLVGDDQLQETWYAHREDWQPITNARAIPDRRRQHELAAPIPVRVRLIWQRDGAELLDTIAVGWAGQLVHVQVRDVRVRIGFAWVHAEHVVRR